MEKDFGAKFEWRRREDNTASIIEAATAFDGYNKANWPKMIEWLMGHLRRLEQAFEPNIPALRQLLRTKFQKSDVREATTS